MAFQRIRETQNKLKEEEMRKQAAMEEATRMKQEGEAQRQELMDKVRLLLFHW